MTTPAHRLLDHLLDDLKKELFAKMQQNVVLELEKRKRDLQSMVENMLEERRTEMLEVLTDKVHKEIKQEFEMYAQATTDAMDSLMGDMKYQLCVHIERMVEKEVSQRFQDQNQSRTTFVQTIEQNCIAIHIFHLSSLSNQGVGVTTSPQTLIDPGTGLQLEVVYHVTTLSGP